MAGGYQIQHKLGEGGFGTVYAAIHPMIGKNAAVKVLNRQCSSNPEMVSRFVAEARAVNQIRHKNIIDIFDFGSLEDGRHYYVMELLEGKPLDSYLEKVHRMPVSDAIPILRAIAKAIDAAHAAGIAHRDLKPENIFLVRDEDGGFTPKLLDFGIAKLLTNSTESQHKTRTGTPMGTPYYMSPEQCRGVNVDKRTDIYSFGVMVHRMLTGSMLFDAESAMDLMMAHVVQPPPPMSTVLDTLRPELDGPVLHMLQKDPSKRPASLSAAVDELAAAAQQAGYTVPGGATLSHLNMTPAQPPSPPASVAIDSVRSPEERHAISQARTMVNTGAPVANQAVFDSSSKRPPWVLPLVALIVVGGLGITAVALKGSGSTGTAATAAVTATVSTPVTSATTNPTAGTATVAASATTAPNEATIALTLETTPPGAEVFLGDAKIGVAPGPINLPRGTEKLTLSVRSAGFVSKTVEVTPAVNASLQVTLVKDPKAAATSTAGGKRTGTNKELENPF
ncbi:MAG: serine/threonine-protein kinase [Polyangiaceae bacterium]